MKSMEELNAIKEEVETLNKEFADLTAKELAQVTGGGFTFCGFTQSEGYRNHNCSKYNPSNAQCSCCYGKPVNKASSEETVQVTEEPLGTISICPWCNQFGYNAQRKYCMACGRSESSRFISNPL